MYVQITLHVFKHDTTTHRLHIMIRINNSEHFIKKSCLQVDLNIILALNWSKVQPESHVKTLQQLLITKMKYCGILKLRLTVLPSHQSLLTLKTELLPLCYPIMTIPAPVLYWKGHFKGLTTDPQESERKYQVGVTYPHVRLPGRPGNFVRLNIAGNSLNAFCPSPQRLHRNDLGILAAISWFRTKILITIKPLPWQTFPVIFMKTSAITSIQFLTILTEPHHGFTGQPFSFWSLHLDQLEKRSGALGSRCWDPTKSGAVRVVEQCRLKQSILLQDAVSPATNSCSEDSGEATLLSRFESVDGKSTSFPGWRIPH